MKRYIKSNAESSLVLNKTSKHTTAAEIAHNLQDEWDAIEGYQKLIPFLELHDDQESIDHIREIISDELNHAEILREMIRKYDGNILTSKD